MDTYITSILVIIDILYKVELIIHILGRISIKNIIKTPIVNFL